MRSIDEWLCCEETGGPFSWCVRCKLPLVEIAQPWLVNKEYSRGECVMEYAICKPCRNATTAKLSEESKEAVRHFLEHEIDCEARVREFMMQSDPARRFDACVACGKERGECEVYGISALFDPGGELVTGALPLLICGGCIRRMKSVMSEESRELWRKFVAEYFDSPPGEAEIPDDGFPGMF